MTVSTRECQSMRLLARDGWSARELKMTMQVSRPQTVRHHVSGDCRHDHDVPSIHDWDGWTAPARASAGQRATGGAD